MKKKSTSVKLKRYFWGYKEYNTKTGLFKGDKHYHSDGTVTDWKGRSERRS